MTEFKRYLSPQLIGALNKLAEKPKWIAAVSVVLHVGVFNDPRAS